ncbi:hypothetical protein DRJ25_03970 [Candidatus Woesearchaeota archaeon]|nr:MAG: hypothetical protein DRJ25_03970 [Candidatus Woesearchaeota archaeon]
MTTAELLEQRGKQYGSLKRQVEEITRIVNALRELRYQHDIKPTFVEEEDIENFFLAFKLCRMQTCDDVDTLDDLVGYATLIKEKRFGNE